MGKVPELATPSFHKGQDRETPGRELGYTILGSFPHQPDARSADFDRLRDIEIRTMPPVPLSPEQLNLVESPPDSRLFLEGPVGAGKTTAGVERLLYMLSAGIPGDSILVFLPQRTLGRTYQAALRHPGVSAGGAVTFLTLSGLAQRMVDLFWPLVAEEAGFAQPDRPPIFLTLETAQYHLAQLVRPLLGEGYFETVVMARNRLYSQILDNLNKAALVGFPYTEIGARLGDAASGDPVQARLYADAQECASLFRQHCLAHNLLDVSLQVEVFLEHLWPYPLCREHVVETYRHIIADNLEENPPVAHDLLAEWLPTLDSALLIYDHDGGYRVFLGADPEGARDLKAHCDGLHRLDSTFVNSPAVEDFGRRLAAALTWDQDSPAPDPGDGAFQPPLVYDPKRFYPQMLDWVAEQIDRLVHAEATPPGEIVVLAPFLGDALRFSLSDRLARQGIPVRSHRPSRALREEPVTQCLLTLALFAHPGWVGDGTHEPKTPSLAGPTLFDLAYALMQAIEGMDLVRAQLLAQVVYHRQEGLPRLASFDPVMPDLQARVTYALGERYERLRDWIETYRQGRPEELDHFLSRLFGEVLAQPGYGFHRHLQAGQITANLIESVRKFRWVAGEQLEEEGVPLGREYLAMVQDGVIAAQYVRAWEPPSEAEVFLAPAYTFLMSDYSVDYQFWLDVGGRSWYQRIYQPLTHPHVLSRRWQTGTPWTDVDEFEAGQAALFRLTQGLIRRCRRGVYLGLSELNEQGFEGRGLLLQAIDQSLHRDGLPFEAFDG